MGLRLWFMGFLVIWSSKRCLKAEKIRRLKEYVVQ